MRRERGFTLIELLIVVAIIGIVAAVAIPNMLNSIDRSRQKKTMADMRYIANALEQYSIDNNYYPLQSSQGAIAGVSAVLSPTYCEVLPDKDGWMWDLRYGTTANGSDYTLRSFGKDGLKNGSQGMTSDFNCDIVIQLGQFTSWPDGVQT